MMNKRTKDYKNKLEICRSTIREELRKLSVDLYGFSGVCLINEAGTRAAIPFVTGNASIEEASLIITTSILSWAKPGEKITYELIKQTDMDSASKSPMNDASVRSLIVENFMLEMMEQIGAGPTFN
jgi:hypothetical protein